MSMQEYWEGRAQRDSWAELYEGTPDLRTYNFITRREAVERLLWDDGAFPRILDVGCATGDYAGIAERHAGEYHGIDFSPSMIAQAQGRHPEGAGRFLVGSGDALPYDDATFDLVLGLGYIEYFADPGPAMREIRRVLRPGGTLVIQGYKWDLFGRFGRHVTQPIRKMMGGVLIRERMPASFVDMRYSKRQLDDLVCRRGFELVEGTYNNFMVFPPIVRRAQPRAYVRLSEWVSRRMPTVCGFLAVNYIGKYRVAQGGAA